MTRTQGLTTHKKIDLAITNTGDYTRSTHPIARVLFPWTETPTKISGPPSGSFESGQTGIAFSPNGEYLAAVCSFELPGPVPLFIYQRVGNTFTQISGPSVPPVQNAQGVAWSYDSHFLAVGHDTSSFINVYKKNLNVFTKISDPATLPTGAVIDVAFSPNGQFLALAHVNSSFVTIYQITSGDVFTKISGPVAASLPTGTAESVEFSPNGEFLAVGHINSAFITIYQRGSGEFSFTKISGPVGAELPSGEVNGISWSPDGRYLAVSPLTIYQRTSGTIFTKLSSAITPSDMPTDSTGGIAWSPDGKFLAVTQINTPFMNVYKRNGNVLIRLPNPASLPSFNSVGVDFSPDQQYLVMASLIGIPTYQTDKPMPNYGILRTIGLPKEGQNQI